MENESMKKLSLVKSKWTKVKFGDVVFEPKESTKDAIADGIKHVVGLEHIESENIHLSNSASIEEATTFTKCFSVGDVLFGRRRAYLKKAAQASFGGICSGDITVFRAKDNLLPALLPFIVSNETFFDYAIKHSAGGLSPRVKFKDLANYEFLLPPKDQQAQLAELLWTMDEVIESERGLLDYTKISLNTTIEKNLENVNEFNVLLFGDLVTELEAGSSVNCKNEEYTKDTVGVLKTSSITGEDFKPFEAKPVLNENIGKLKMPLKKGNILFNRKNTPELVGSIKFLELDYPNLYCPDLIWQITINDLLAKPKFVSYYMSSRSFRNKVASVRNGTSLSMVNVSQKNILKIPISLPPLIMQEKILIDINKYETAIRNTKSKLKTSQTLQKSLINQIFG